MDSIKTYPNEHLPLLCLFANIRNLRDFKMQEDKAHSKRFSNYVCTHPSPQTLTE